MLNGSVHRPREFGLDEVLRALSNELRRWILIAVARQPGCCAADLGRLLGYDRPTMTKQLNALKALGLITEQPDGPVMKRLLLSKRIQVDWTGAQARIRIFDSGEWTTEVHSVVPDGLRAAMK